jgi:hypothetical protein
MNATTSGHLSDLRRADLLSWPYTDERLARAELRRQIGRLELELSRLTLDGFGRVAVPRGVGATAPAARMLDLGELERLRDALAERAGEARTALIAKAAIEEANRELLRNLIESPGDYRWVRVSRAAVGEPGCGHWHSRPRLGPIGMLMGWWRVKVSSGCPLAGRLAAASIRRFALAVRLQQRAKRCRASRAVERVHRETSVSMMRTAHLLPPRRGRGPGRPPPPCSELFRAHSYPPGQARVKGRSVDRIGEPRPGGVKQPLPVSRIS